MGSVEAVFEGFDRAAELVEVRKAGIELALGGRLVRVVELQGAKLRGGAADGAAEGIDAAKRVRRGLGRRGGKLGWRLVCAEE